MTRRVRWRRALGATAAAVGLVMAALPAGAEGPTEVGWWWLGRPLSIAPAAVSPAPAPPEGGLYVAGGLGGPSGISALRFEVDADATVGSLTLTIADATGNVAIDACAAGGDWDAAENGGWDQRPEFDCEAASVSGTVDEDQTEVSFMLSPLQGDDGVIDVVLVPGLDPVSQEPADFSAAFEPPGGAALAVRPPIDSSTSSTVTDAATDEAAAPAAPGSVFVSPPIPRVSTGLDTGSPSAGETAAPTALTGDFGGDDGFAYPTVMALPLVLLCAAGYLGWALTRPVTVPARVHRTCA